MNKYYMRTQWGKDIDGKVWVGISAQFVSDDYLDSRNKQYHIAIFGYKKFSQFIRAVKNLWEFMENESMRMLS